MALKLINSRGLIDNVCLVVNCVTTFSYAIVTNLVDKEGFWDPELFLTETGKMTFYASLILPGIMTHLIVPATMYYRNHCLRTEVYREMTDKFKRF